MSQETECPELTALFKELREHTEEKDCQILGIDPDSFRAATGGILEDFDEREKSDPAYRAFVEGIRNAKLGKVSVRSARTTPGLVEQEKIAQDRFKIGLDHNC